MKRILIVSPAFPLPANFGGTKDIWNRILVLKSLGYSLDLVYTEENEVQDKVLLDNVREYISNVYYVKREAGIGNIMSFIPYQAKSRQKLSIINFLNEKYDYTILEGDSVAEVLDNKTVEFGKIVLRVHNNESKYFFKLFKSTFPSPNCLYYLSDSIKFVSYSKKLNRLINNFMYISSNEKDKHKYREKHQVIALMPDFPKESFFPFNKNAQKNVLFIGSLFMPNNVESIKWYIENVHEELTKLIDSYTFTIVGSTKGKDMSKINKMVAGFNNISVQFDVPSVRMYYEKAAIFVNPMFNGAGVKIKSIEAIVNGVPLVSTSIGVEGTGLKSNRDIIIADSAKEFCDAIETLLNDENKREELVAASLEFVKKLTHEKLLPQFLEMIS